MEEPQKARGTNTRLKGSVTMKWRYSIKTTMTEAKKIRLTAYAACAG